jgi:hypothetical protein
MILIAAVIVHFVYVNKLTGEKVSFIYSEFHYLFSISPASIS